MPTGLSPGWRSTAWGNQWTRARLEARGGEVYVEGGGDSNTLKTACREGFSKFLGKGWLGRAYAARGTCGSRADAYDSFCTAISNGEAAMLLVDSEAPVAADAQQGDGAKREDWEHWQPWLHLKQRQGRWLTSRSAVMICNAT